jgi:BirA family biotin operon repressor/biotin-[acetyl-CoA-carboxylase] ligase
VWTAPPRSSLLVSVLLRPSPNTAGFSGMALGVAAADAIAETVTVAVRLKWPNDVVWPGRGDSSDRKLGGILAEADWSNPAAPAVVVGLGLNVNWPAGFPDELAGLAASLNHVAGREIDREGLLIAILQHLEGWCDRGRDVVGAMRDRSATLGNRVRVELANERLVGDAVDITDDGHLVVRLDDGSTRTITAGDVIHVRPA